MVSRIRLTLSAARVGRSRKKPPDVLILCGLSPARLTGYGLEVDTRLAADTQPVPFLPARLTGRGVESRSWLTASAQPVVLTAKGCDVGINYRISIGTNAGWRIPNEPYEAAGTWYSQTAGQTYNVSQHVDSTGTTFSYSITSQTKNAVVGEYGFTIDQDTGVITVPSDLPNPVTTDSYSVQVSLTEAVTTTGDLPTLTVSSSTGAWTFGQPIKKGAAVWLQGPAGTQVEIRNRWSDGSVKFAVISGVNVGSATLTATSSNPYTSGHLTQAAMVAAISSCSITVGSQTVDVKALLNTAPQRTVCTGPVMSNWIFRQALTVGTDMSLWVDVRYYSNGTVELFPWVEIGQLGGTNPGRGYGYRAVIVLNGSTVYDQSVLSVPFNVTNYTGTSMAVVFDTSATYAIWRSGGTYRVTNGTYWATATWTTDSPVAGTYSLVWDTVTPATLTSIQFNWQPAWTRIPLISGSTLAYRTSGAEITPTHDTTYLKATKLVPNYGYTPSETFLAGRTTTYTPNAIGQGISVGMGAGGGEGSINHPNCAAYVASNADVRAYRAAMVLGLSSGSWSTHYRDGTGEPFKFSAYPNPAPAAITGGTNGTASVTHLPGFALIPYLISGRWWFLDELLSWCNEAFVQNSYRQGARAICDPTHAIQARGAAWSLNTYAHALMMLPETHPNRSDLIYAWEQNCAFYRAVFVDNAPWPTWDRNGTYWVSPQGFMGTYASNSISPYGQPSGVNAWFDAAFMQNYQVVVWGTSSDYDLPVSAQAQADHIAVRNHAYLQVVTRAGDGTSTNWRRFAAYAWAFGEDATGMPVETWYTPAQAYAKFVQGYLLDANLPATEGLSLKQHPGTDPAQYYLGDVDISVLSPYGASALMGLALAREHGASGAVDGYRRITTASNAAVFQTYYATNPAFGVVPR